MRIVRLCGPESALCELDGVLREVNVSLLDAPQVDHYVIVHAGFAIQQLDPMEAAEQLALLAELSRPVPSELPSAESSVGGGPT